MPKRDLKFNVNDDVRVKLRPAGLLAVEAHYKKHGLDPAPYLAMMKPEDGWYTMPLWEFMNLLGPHTYMGPPTPFETEVVLLGVEVPDA